MTRKRSDIIGAIVVFAAFMFTFIGLVWLDSWLLDSMMAQHSTFYFILMLIVTVISALTTIAVFVVGGIFSVMLLKEVIVGE